MHLAPCHALLALFGNIPLSCNQTPTFFTPPSSRRFFKAVLWGKITPGIKFRSSIEMKTVCGVPQVPLAFFLENILPPSAEWHAVVENRLVDGGHIVAGRWQCESARSAEVERENNLVFMIETIVRTGQGPAPHPATCRFLLAPKISESSQQRVPPDAQLELVDCSRFRVAIPWIFHSKRATPECIEEELMWSCADILNSDPCRRFSYGITVRDDNATLWFFSRSHELVSSPFNGTTEPHNLIRIVLSLAFANPEELGYDTTVSHLLDNTGTPIAQVKLTVGNSVYVTKKMLSDCRRDGIWRRATRVWEAYREDDPERAPVAIKDVWVAADAVQEGDQLMELHQKLQGLTQLSLPHPPGQYFLTVVEHGFVPTSDGADDDTLLMIGGITLDGQYSLHLKHYRIVFQEIGTPIHGLESLSDIMRALADATRALQLLYWLGLVHRDVSAGNILFVDGVGKLVDLEFMKRYKGLISSSYAEQLIGTPTYTAGEVAAEAYGYASRHFRPVGVLFSERKPFRFNPFHDIESTLWIAIWTLFRHRRNLPECKEFFDDHFPRHFTKRTFSMRMVAISSGFLSLEESDPFYAVLETLHDARFELFLHYARFESNIGSQYHFLEDELAPRKGSPFGDIHSIFIAHYEKAAECFEGLLLPLTQSLKRKADPQPGVDVNTPSTSLERPAKKLKSSSPQRSPTTRSSDGSDPHGPKNLLLV
ncbi:hypothetical protein R3P38DRAFT_1225605 [Favolaschia claudopus]|uniref:Protein kinase domain-containing protein n=1 Tax=Favolaschia claudopus TaxID=2862362 RepID=A0AAW0B1P8_9AGAR